MVGVRPTGAAGARGGGRFFCSFMGRLGAFQHRLRRSEGRPEGGVSPVKKGAWGGSFFAQAAVPRDGRLLRFFVYLCVYQCDIAK